MYNSIILSSCLLGSFYLCSKSLEFINRSFLEKKISRKLFLINGFTIVVSGAIIIFSFRLLNLPHLKSLNV